MTSRDEGTRVTTFLDLDLALEWCETLLIMALEG